MISALRQMLAVFLLMSLVACGGSDGNQMAANTGEGSNNPPSGEEQTTDEEEPSDTLDIADLEVQASSRQLPSSGDEPVIISAVVKNSDNNIIKDAEVSFAVDNGASIAPSEESAGSAVKTAELTPGLGKPENRPLMVTIRAGEQERTLAIEVVGTTLQIEGPERVVSNDASTYTAKLQDSAGDGIGIQDLSISTEQGSEIQLVEAASFTTDTNGEIQFNIVPKFVESETITVAALGASYSKTIDISNDKFSLSSANEEIRVNTEETIQLSWTSSGTPQANKTIDLLATRGKLPRQVVTDAKGEASFTISSNTAGGTYIVATDKESSLSTNLVREFVAFEPSYLNVQAEKSVIAPEESTKIIAHVRDANDNPIKNQVVAFVANDAVNGELSDPSATTDSLGRASVVYTPGNAMSAKDGVTITSSLPDHPEIADASTQLTVGDLALRLVLGEDEKLSEDGVFYKKTFGVIVTDSAGNAVQNAELNFSIHPLEYYKGTMVCEEGDSWAMNLKAACFSEDLENNNGRLDVGEDFNNNGKLDPTYAASVERQATTDAEGKATVTITYPQSEAMWSKVRLTATVLSNGTEYLESTAFILPILADDVGSCDTSPPNHKSPYGAAESCENPN